MEGRGKENYFYNEELAFEKRQIRVTKVIRVGLHYRTAVY